MGVSDILIAVSYVDDVANGFKHTFKHVCAEIDVGQSLSRNGHKVIDSDDVFDIVVKFQLVDNALIFSNGFNEVDCENRTV